MRIKGFDENLCCRGIQFEIGKEYKIATDRKLELCTDTVFHYCDTLRNVHEFYPVTKNNRYCEIEVLGEEIHDNECKKYGSNHIKILREIAGEELKQLKGLNGGNTGIFNTGNCNTGNYNTGHWNTGNCNTGNRNTGHWNTGYYNTGNRNAGNCNTGNCNTGYYNTGNRNTGDWNKSSHNTGCFNTLDEQKIMLFNKVSNWTYKDWLNSDARNLMYQIPRNVVEWIETKEMSDEEKTANPTHETTGGYLKVFDESESAQAWWDELSDRDRKTIMELPNFDATIFMECTGIKVS